MTSETETAERPAPQAPMPSRRRFLVALSLTLGAVAATLVGVPVVGFVLGAVRGHRPSVWRRVGAAESFVIGQTVAVRFENASALPWDGVSAGTAVWLRHVSEGEFVAFSVNCTHLGCPVQWKADANLFMCPCHGGVYYANGDVAGGPPPRPLPRCQVRVVDGMVEVETGVIPIV